VATFYRTTGYIIKKTDLREADQLFAIYTKDFGRIDVLGRAIRKIKSKLRSGAELLNFSEIEFIQGKGYKILTDAILINKFNEIRKNPEKIEVACKISDVLNQMVKAPESDEKIFDLLSEAWNRLKIDKPSLSILVYYYFFWNLVSLLGYQIDLYNCTACEKKLVPLKLYFNADEGGIFCDQCFDKARERVDISPQTIKIIRLLLKKDWNILERLKIDDEHIKELKKISSCFLDKIIL